MSFPVSPVMQVGKDNPIQGQRAPSETRAENTPSGRACRTTTAADAHVFLASFVFVLQQKSFFVLLFPLFNSKAMKSNEAAWKSQTCGVSFSLDSAPPLPFSRINHSLEPTSSLKWEALTSLLPLTHPLIRRSPPLPPTRTLLGVLRALALPFCSSASHLSLSSPISAHPFPSPRSQGDRQPLLSLRRT